MMILGMNLLIGGLLVTIIVVGNPLVLPLINSQPLNQSATLGLIMTLAGFAVLSIGFLLLVHYDRKRSWHLGEIEKSTLLRNRKIKVRSTSEILEELTEKE